MKPTHIPAYMRFALLMAMLCSFATATAYDFEVDGIYYNKTSATTVEVTYKDTNYGSYSGDITIPSTITVRVSQNYQATFTVTAIGDSAFYDCMVNDVTIPETVTSIGEGAFCSFWCFNSITCLALTPPSMNGSFDYHYEGHLDPAWATYDDGEYVFLSDLSLCVPDEAYDSYKMLNDVYHCFSFIIKIGAGKTQAPVVVQLMNNDIILPSEGELHTCIAYYNTWGNWPEFIIGSWWDDDDFEYSNLGEWRSLAEITYAYSIEEGKEPSEIVQAVTNSYSNLQGSRYNYDFIEDGLCYYLGCELTSDIWYEWYRMYNDDGDYEIVYEDHHNYYSGDINIPSAVRFGDVISISSIAFKNCEELNSVFVPLSIKSIGYGAFTGCPNLNILNVENGNTTFDSRDNCNAIIETANNKLIVGCNNTIIPSTVICIGDSAFAGSGITKLSIPNTITSIGRGAFWQCNRLSTLLLTGDGAWTAGALDVAVQRLDIASDITAIPGLKVNPREVYCYANVPPTCDENTFTDYTGTLHVPESSLAAYFTAPYWCNFANIVGDAVELTNLTLNKDSAELLVDEQLTLNATIQPANANIDSITWESSNEEIATVVNGVVTAKALGECDIIVTCLDKRAVCHVKVVEQVTTITLDQHRASLLPNHILTLTPTVTPEPTDLVVTSSNPSVAAARLANGKVQVVGVSVGNAIIKVSSADGKAIADSCFVNVYTDVGDVDCDGFVKINDVTALIDHLLGSNSSIDVGNADINYDGVVTIADVTELIDCLLSGTSMTTRETFTVNGVSFTMIRVPAGTFMMGATAEQGDDFIGWERPVHEVTLSSYSVGETEVTQELWQAVMGSNPSKHTGDLQLPVENVSWTDCQEFIAQLNALTGRNFRLPTEAEWEFAARGGNRSKGYKYAGSNNVNDVAWIADGTNAVAQLQPNELYLYDMSGNVEEWINDYWSSYTSAPQTNPTGPETGTNRVYRGGSWYSGEPSCRVSFRMSRAESFKRGTMGLRLAL